MGTSFTRAMTIAEQGVEITPLDYGIMLDWTFEEASLSIDEDGYSLIEINGTDQLTQPGYPQIPFVSRLVAVPPGSHPILEIKQVLQHNRPISAPLRSIGSAQQPDIAGRSEDQLGSYPRLNSTDTFSIPVASLSPAGIMRGVNLFRLNIYPARPSDGQLIITQYIQLTINFEKESKRQSTVTPSSDPLITGLSSLTINPDQIQANPRIPPEKTDGEVNRLLNDPTAIIEVSQIGLTSVSYEDLQAIVFPVDSINPHFVHIERAGTEIPFEWVGDVDTSFELDEKILFFANPRFSRWSRTDSYYLYADQNSHLEMDTRSVDPTGLDQGTAWVESTSETNLIYTPDCFCGSIPAGHDGDRWVWDRLWIPTNSSGSYPIELTAVDSTQVAQLTVWLIGQTDTIADPDHRVQFSIIDQDNNKHYLGETKWDGKQAWMEKLQIPAGLLHTGLNNLSLDLPGIPNVTVEGMWLDAFSIRYVRDANEVSGNSILFTGDESQKAYSISLADLEGLQVYDVTDSDAPIRLSTLSENGNQISVGDPVGVGVHRYWITNSSGISQPANLRLVQSIATPDSGADYLVIAPQVFIPNLSDLISLRQAQGLKVAVVDVQAIYDQFGDGRPDPEAIREFLTYAYFNWENPPIYVLLVGDGTSDPKQYITSSSQTFIPPYLDDVDPWAGETAADNRFVTVDGDDPLPDMLIGRLPANTAEEVQAMVDKIVGYEQNPVPGEWKIQAGYIADNADTAGNFPVLSDALINQFPTPPFTPERFYYSTGDTTLEEFRQALLETWNDGKALMVFMGHASIHQWAAELFFHLEDIPKLNNGSRLPVLLELTCFTGSFQVPGYPTLDESLLRHSAGGVIAVWGSTGLGISTGHHWLAQGFMESIVNSNHPTVGESILAGKLKLAATGTHLDLIDTYTLFGDPVSPLERSYQDFIPLARR